MMNIDKLAICNMALANIGSPTIQSLTEQNAGARACKLRYDEARVEALSSSLWNFASLWQVGVRLDIDSKPPWAYVYTYPPDALRVFEILRVSKEMREIPFEITDRPDQAGKLIHTDEPAPTFVYTRDKEDPTTFDWDFITALSWLLAHKICMPVTKNAKMADNALKMWTVKSSKAEARTMNEGVRDTDQTPTYQAVR